MQLCDAICSIYFLLQDYSTFICSLIEIEREGRVSKIQHIDWCQLAHIFFRNWIHYEYFQSVFFVWAHFFTSKKKPIVLIWEWKNVWNAAKKWNIYWKSRTSQIQWNSLLWRALWSLFTTKIERTEKLMAKKCHPFRFLLTNS